MACCTVASCTGWQGRAAKPTVTVRSSPPTSALVSLAGPASPEPGSGVAGTAFDGTGSAFPALAWEPEQAARTGSAAAAANSAAPRRARSVVGRTAPNPQSLRTPPQ